MIRFSRVDRAVNDVQEYLQHAVQAMTGKRAPAEWISGEGMSMLAANEFRHFGETACRLRFSHNP